MNNIVKKYNNMLLLCNYTRCFNRVIICQEFSIYIKNLWLECSMKNDQFTVIDHLLKCRGEDIISVISVIILFY